jgi:hypothetical protein
VLSLGQEDSRFRCNLVPSQTKKCLPPPQTSIDRHRTPQSARLSSPHLQSATWPIRVEFLCLQKGQDLALLSAGAPQDKLRFYTNNCCSNCVWTFFQVHWLCRAKIGWFWTEHNTYECTWKEIQPTQSLKQPFRFILYQFSDRTADRSGRAVYGRSIIAIAPSKPIDSMKVPLMCLLCAVYVEVSATDWSLTQRSPSDCAWTVSRPIPSWAAAPLKDKLKPLGFVWWNLAFDTGHWSLDMWCRYVSVRTEEYIDMWHCTNVL